MREWSSQDELAERHASSVSPSSDGPAGRVHKKLGEEEEDAASHARGAEAGGVLGPEEGLELRTSRSVFSVPPKPRAPRSFREEVCRLLPLYATTLWALLTVTGAALLFPLGR